MLNTTIPTLEIKTTGIDLSTVESMYITIKQDSFQAIKSNADIEVDNDVISLSLTQNEVTQFAEMAGISITIQATGHDDKTSTVKIVWVKRGSRTSHTAGSGSGGGTTVSNEIWYPTLSADGIITWAKSTSETTPTPRNIKGPKGNDGITPHIDSATGNWFIGTVNTGVKARGTDGVTPTIGANGNWHIGSNDTGVKAKGIDGKDGIDGEDGFSPAITENPGNNDTTYKLDITTKTGSFTTPNLKGKDGTGGSSGGLTEQDVQTLIDDAFQENMSGAKIAKNEKGEWGYIPPGADSVVPFSKGGSSGGDGLSVLPNDGTFLYKSNVANTSYGVADSGERLMVINRS